MDKLGIYIPTKDRPVELKECLNSLIYQVKQFGFPIYISDNSGNDETKKLVVKLRENYRKIYYRRNPYKGLNGTYASNLKSVIEMGKTEFVWFLGDDDIIFKNAVNKIAKNLNGNQFLQINMAIYDNNLTKILNHRVIKRYKDMEYYPGMHEEVMLNAQPDGYVGFMGSIITKLDILMYELQKIKKIDNWDFLHTVLFYRSIINKKGKFLATPLIKYRSGISSGKRNFEIWLESYYHALFLLDANYNSTVLRRVARRNDIFNIAAMAKRDFSNTAMKNISIVLQNNKISDTDKIFLIFILLIPSRIYKFLTSLDTAYVQ